MQTSSRSAAERLPGAVHRYLEAFELELKRQPGVSPEEALSDAREFLSAATDDLRGRHPPIDEERLYRQLARRFGEPAEVARQYADGVRPPLFQASGHAPGWRICCTTCGRGAPLASVGGVRVGAASVHKYTLGYCRDCRRLRFFRVVRDMDEPNLTRRLGSGATPGQLRRTMHRPVLVILVILLSVVVIKLLVAWSVTSLR